MTLRNVAVHSSCDVWIVCHEPGVTVRMVCPVCLFSQMCSFAFYCSGVHLQTRAILPPFGPSATRPSPLHPVSASNVACCLCPPVILMAHLQLSNLVTRPLGGEDSDRPSGPPTLLPKEQQELLTRRNTVGSLTTHVYLVPKLGILGAAPPFLHTP
jgi:hypothetical protein